MTGPAQKKLIGWTMDTEYDKISLPDRNFWELLTPIDLLSSQLHMIRKDLE